MAKHKKKPKRESQQRVSEKIALLRREGKTGEQAAGEAYSMERSGRLGRHGMYHRKGKRKSKRKGSRY